MFNHTDQLPIIHVFGTRGYVCVGIFALPVTMIFRHSVNYVAPPGGDRRLDWRRSAVW